ncbi:MAG TPA: ATP-binding cassette domain-containing protein, partial [Rectinemataceae bacterium]|nr:ATP-binding cassette domain-containing protein [Rectinemataceae bacterium]
KTTFLKTCLGLIPPLGGELRLFGVDTRSLRFSGIRKKMAYVPQNRPAGGSDRVRISVREAVSFGRLGKTGLLGSLDRRDKLAIGEAIERCGLGNLVDAAVQDLSGGQYQRVAIARAMAAEPELYLFDEPGSFLDAEGQTAMRGFITSLAGSGSSMIVVTHDRGLLALCGAILGFESGGASLLAQEDFADGALGGEKGLNDGREVGS